MKSIASILAKHRKKMNLSQPEVAALLAEKGVNVTVKALSSWETDRTEPPIRAFFALCQILEIEDVYEEVFGMNPYNRINKFNEAGQEKINDYMNLLEAAGGYMKETGNIVPFTNRTIHLYNLPVSAGLGQFLDGEDYEDLEIDSTYSTDVDFAVRVKGDSMEPKFTSGQVIFVHKQDTLEHGEIGVFYLDGQAYVKKLQKNRKGIALISLNKEYKPIPVKEFNDLKIFGKVVD